MKSLPQIKIEEQQNEINRSHRNAFSTCNKDKDKEDYNKDK